MTRSQKARIKAIKKGATLEAYRDFSQHEVIAISPGRGTAKLRRLPAWQNWRTRSTTLESMLNNYRLMGL